MKKKNYTKGIFWFFLSLGISCLNDAITKYLGCAIGIWQLSFFRFLGGTITLLPIMVYKGRQTFTTTRIYLHIIRGLFLLLAMGLWTYGATVAPITTVTIMSFTVPIFVLILARIFLKEKVPFSVWIATLLVLVGIIGVLKPTIWSYHYASLGLIIAGGGFGILDILNKKYVNKEPIYCMLFYPSLVATLLIWLPALYTWQPITLQQLGWLGILGVGGNVILYCLLKAFSKVAATTLAPLKYLELPLSASVGHICFKEIPSAQSCLGAAIIIPATLFIIYRQKK